ncbi:MAG: DUF1800 domain-containing protein, partial [Oceanobacter sp.]
MVLFFHSRVWLGVLASLALSFSCLQPVYAATEVGQREAIQLLQQASFGPSSESIQRVQSLGLEGWVDWQLSLPRSQSQLLRTMEIAFSYNPEYDWYSTGRFNPGNYEVERFQLSTWWQQALLAEDQLRQRVAFALSQIMVVSNVEKPLDQKAEGLAAYNDILLKHAFGNFRDLMWDVSLSPAMGIFLSHQGNRKADAKTNTSPDENYARELMQLFSLGLYQRRIDGAPVLDDDGQQIPTYSQQDVMALARVLTGWDMVGNLKYGESRPSQMDAVTPMEFSPEYHDSGDKQLLGQEISGKVDGYQELSQALDIVFQQPSVAPNISHLLIQRLVTSNPSPAYIRRVSRRFEDNGHGVRGDLAAVVRAIILDPEARQPSTRAEPKKLKEPVLAWAGLLRRLEVAPLPEWINHLGAVQTDLLWMKDLNIGQNPFRSPSVFNFYSPDYQPNLKAFLTAGMVAPEASLLSTSVFTGFYNHLEFLLNFMDTRSSPDKRFEKLKVYHPFLVEVDISIWVDKSSFIDEFVVA